MAGARRDVELAFRVSTLGEEGIRQLEQDIRELAAEGGAAAPRFEQLADEVARLGLQARQLDEFSRIAREVDELAASQRRAVDATSAVGAELIEAAAATDRFRQAQIAAKDVQRQAQTELQAAKDSLRSLKLDLVEGKIAQETFDKEALKLKRTLLEQEQEVRRLGKAYADAKTAASDAARAESTLEKSYGASNRAAEAAGRTIAERNADLRDARAALADAGIATNNLASAQATLVNALNTAGRATEEEIAAQKRATDERRAAALEEERLAGVMFRSRQAMQDAAKAEADSIIRDFDRMQAAERAAAQEAQNAARTITQAFSTVGGKSVAELRGEIDKVRAAMNTLRTTSSLSGAEIEQAMVLGNRKIKDLEKGIRAATGELTLMDRVGNLLNHTLGHVGIAGVVFLLIQQVQRLGAAFLTANKEIEATRLGLNVLYKDTALTSRQIDFLRGVADRAGVSVGSISQSFIKFSASMHASNIPLEQSNALFAAITQTAGTLGLSGDKVSHMLDALSQMAGKGTVSLEELRQQLGDSLPGALSLVAKGLGLTEQKLIKLIESGGLAARDLFPALTKALKSMQGEVDTISSGWERFKNLLTTTSQAAGDAGWTDALKGALSAITFVLKPLLMGLVLLSEGIFNVARMAGAAAGALLGGDGLSGALDAAAEKARESADRITSYGKALDGSVESAQDATQAAKQQAAATQAGVAATTSATTAVAGHTGALQSNATAAGTAAAAQVVVGASVDQAAAKALLASKNIVQLASEYADLAKTLDNVTQVAEKAAKAREIEGQSIQTIAQLTGDQRTNLQAATDAALVNMEAQQRLLAARSAETAALRNYIVVLQEEVRLHGDPDGVRKKELEDRQKKLDLLAVEEQRTRNAVEAGRLEVASKRQARQAYEDLSGSVDVLRTAMENAQATQQAYEAVQKQGYATQEQVNDAKRRAAELEGLYRDALNDSVIANELAIQKITGRNQVEQAALNLDAERARSLGTLAKATKDHTLEVQAEVMGIEVEVQSRLKNAAAMTQETQQRLVDLDALRANQKGLGDWTTAKELEYQKTRSGLEAKLKEAEAIKESTKSLERQIQTLREAQQAESDYAGYVDRSTNAIRMKNKALEELYNRNRVLNSQTTNDGFTKNADGSAAGQFTNTLQMDQAVRLQQTGGKGMSQEEIATAIQQADNAFRDMQAFTRLNPGASSTEYQQSVTALENAANRARQGQNAGTMKTVNIRINGGQVSPVNVADDQSANNLVSVLRGLETQSRSAA